MIYSVSGRLISKAPDEAVIEAGGIGYRIAIPTCVYGSLPEIGENALLYTQFVVKEDAFELYGFETLEQKMLFKTLTSVSGVGTKIGLAVLSVSPPERISLAIASGDHKAFTTISGIGPKLAQRIVLELKDKVGPMTGAEGAAAGAVAEQQQKDDALEALMALGFSRPEASKALLELPEGMPLERRIASALKSLSRRR